MRCQKRIVVARKLGLIDDVLIFCEHPHVIRRDVTESANICWRVRAYCVKRVLSFLKRAAAGT